jgi:porphobilinogen synthase
LSFPTERPRRLRQDARVRRLVRETDLSPRSLVAPVFVCGGEGIRRPIEAMPGCSVTSVDLVADDALALEALGVGGVLLFGVPDWKDETGSSAWDPEGPVPRALRALRNEAPGLLRWADVCLCEYTSHGHCGVLVETAGGDVRVDNDGTLPLLARASIAYAEAGADVIAPSDMMDGRVGRIRQALDSAGFADAVVCSYAVKYASAFYGPFREAADSRPQRGDRRGYQMDPSNAREALREAALDVAEGADLVMVKPALTCLDIITRVRAETRVPVAAYNVSGEYAMVKAAAARGWIDERAAMMETLTAIRRAGADVIVSYFAKDAARAL